MDSLVNSIRHWRGRRELHKLILNAGRNGDRSCLLCACMEILENCPELAAERFPHRSLSNKMNIYPLSFLLMNGATLESIERVHSYYPEAARQKVTAKSAATDYPLHLACVLGGVSESLILFLANAYPEAVAIKNSSGSLPLHVLLRNRRHSFTLLEIQSLLDLYEKLRGPYWGHCTRTEKTSWTIAKGDWREGNNDYGAILSLALRNGCVERNILDFLVLRFPSQNTDSFYLGRVTPDFSVGFFLRQRTNYMMTESRMQSLCGLLPHLKVFSCTPKNWVTSGYLVLMTELCHNQSLVELILSFPPSLLRDDAPSRSLQRVLQENTTLQRLHIDFPAFCKSMQVDEVEAAAKKGFQACLKGLMQALHDNHTLKGCLLTGDLIGLLDANFRSCEFWPTLANLMESHNTTLETMDAEAFQHDLAATDKEKVEYFTSLNKYGRGRLRNPTRGVKDVVGLLVAAQKSLAHDKESLKMVRVLYGLLLDSPSTWAGAGWAAR